MSETTINLNNLVLYCRPGFEKECASEIMDIMVQASLFGFIKSKPDSGYVVFCLHTPTDIQTLNQAIHFSRLVFARQCILATELIKDLPVDDRISPLLEEITKLNLAFKDVWLETPDTNEGKELNNFCTRFSKPLLNAMNKKSCIDPQSKWRLHLFFINSSTVYPGISHIDNSSSLIMGIPRLRMPHSAPSRSTLKLDEAFNVMLTENERSHLLRNGMTAVDLGASPGGWTWQLVNRNIRVTAIDNGKMNQSLMDSGLVEHVRADGFKYIPDKPVDWLVCDMVERPLHVSRLIARWLSKGWCKNTAFNLKLPMKQRYQISQECKQLIEAALKEVGIKYEIRMKQLYHDREEITCIVLTQD
ncbi:MAG TPA: 23S rRNA (cytidine(2498)-2'-O)-methyltransferase RlmM [Gammaproteobacteria bacterium]